MKGLISDKRALILMACGVFILGAGLAAIAHGPGGAPEATGEADTPRQDLARAEAMRIGFGPIVVTMPDGVTRLTAHTDSDGTCTVLMLNDAWEAGDGIAMTGSENWWQAMTLEAFEELLEVTEQDEATAGSPAADDELPELRIQEMLDVKSRLALADRIERVVQERTVVYVEKDRADGSQRLWVFFDDGRFAAALTVRGDLTDPALRMAGTARLQETPTE